MSRKFLLIATFVLTTSLVASISYAEHQTPVFSGVWYSNATLKYVDACGQSAFDYFQQVTSSEALANTLLAEVPQHENCQWGEVALSADNEKMPVDFPGNDKDWQSMMNSTHSVMKAERNCLSASGERVDQKVTYVYPAYQCPAGTRASIDRQDGTPGCTTTPVVCNADVIGRELNVFGARRLGHLGMTRGFDNTQVYDQSVEVFQAKSGEPVTIALNPIDLFKHTEGAIFWGEKFGVQDAPILTESDANLILTAGLAQRRYPLSYTVMWDFHPGSDGLYSVYNQQTHNWDRVLAATNAKFRCDSFVYYSYLTGANLHIVPEFKFPLVPKDLLAAMQTCRNAEGERCLPAASLLRVSSSKLQAVELESAFASKELDIEVADKASYAYMHNTNVSRAAKLNLLWALALKYTHDVDKFSYLLDCLASLHPTELVSELVQQYAAQSEVGFKRKIVETVVSALQFTNADEARSNNYLAEVVKGQNFVREVLVTTTDSATRAFLMQMYVSIAPLTEAEQTIHRLLDVKSIKATLSAEEKSLLTLRMAFATPERQVTLLPALLTKSENKANLCFIVSNLKTTWIAEGIKPALREVLIANKNTLLTQDCHWLAAYATVTAGSEQEKTAFMLNYIRHESNVTMQAQLLSQLSKPQLKQISLEDKTYYRARFTQPLKAVKGAAGEKRALQRGISSLYGI